jgi:hypothetical protein
MSTRTDGSTASQTKSSQPNTNQASGTQTTASQASRTPTGAASNSGGNKSQTSTAEVCSNPKKLLKALAQLVQQLNHQSTSGAASADDLLAECGD